MRYRIIYSDYSDVMERDSIEEYADERQALGRARELLDDGAHHGLAVADGDGNVLHGVRLQLKLGASSRD